MKNRLIELYIKRLVRGILQEDVDYKGWHEAPTKEDVPLYNLIDAYGEDIYSSNAVRYFGDGYPYDAYSINIMQRVRNKPKALVKIYRAVPDFNRDYKKQKDKLSDLISYHNKFNFFPMKNEIIHSLQDKYPIEKYSYDEQQDLIFKDLYKQIRELNDKMVKPVGINSGDWVTINPLYAKEHGQGNLDNKFKVLTKTVRASELFTDGNSIHEFGYNV
jgi:hypothetical protein